MSNGEKPIPQEDIAAFERAAKGAEEDEDAAASSESKPLKPLENSDATKNAVRRMIDKLEGR